jgi:hypothetical protein
MSNTNVAIKTVWQNFSSMFRKPKGIEVDFRFVSPKELHRRTIEDGCVLLRNAIPEGSVIRYRDMLEEIYQDIAKRMKSGEHFTDWKRVHIQDDDFTARYGPDNSLFKLLDAPKFTVFMDALFGKGRHRPSFPDTVCRSVHLQQLDPTSLTLSPIHLDGLYHETWPYFAINFWIPFSACGTGTDLPGIVVYPSSFEDVRDVIDIHTAEELKARRSAAPNGVIPIESLAAPLATLYSRNAIEPVAPHFEIGDVMLINSWTPHGSFTDGKMQSHRRNVELRFCGDSWNPKNIGA